MADCHARQKRALDFNEDSQTSELRTSRALFMPDKLVFDRGCRTNTPDCTYRERGCRCGVLSRDWL